MFPPHIEMAADGRSAQTEANFIAYHFIEAGHDDGTPVPTGGKATDWVVAGRYQDRMERRDGVWLIVRRDAVHDWERADAANA
jgi:SnoaL-like domain